MSNSKMEKLLLQIKADLSDLKSIRAELNTIKGQVGQAGMDAGRDFTKNFNAQFGAGANKAKEQIKDLGQSASSFGGIVTKIGGTIAGLFALDKVVDFFKSAIEEAEKAEKAIAGMGGTAADSFKKAEADIESSFKIIKDLIGPALLQVKRIIAEIVATLASGVAAIAQFLKPRDVDTVTKQYQTQKKALIELGSEMDKLNGVKDKTLEQELQLIKSQGALRNELEKVGLNYNEVTAKAKSYLDVINIIANKRKADAKSELLKQASDFQAGAGQSRQDEQRLERELKVAASNVGSSRAFDGNVGERIADQKRQVQKIREALVEQKIRTRDLESFAKRAAQGAANLDKVTPEEKVSTNNSSGAGIDNRQESRFLDSRLRLRTIEDNREYTEELANRYFKEEQHLAKLALKRRKINKEEYDDRIDLAEQERDRRIKMGYEEARQAAEAEFNSLRQGLAEFIEDKNAARLEALKNENDNARRLSFNLLEAELKQARGNEDEIALAKEKNIKRLSDIESANTRKQAKIHAQSFGETLTAVNSILGGFQEFGQGKGGGLSSIAAGFGGLSSTFKKGGLLENKKAADVSESLGIFAFVTGAAEGLQKFMGTVFQKSDLERQAEAEAQALRDKETQEILERQANYAKNMLALQEAAAKLPFEDLQRNLRLIEIRSSQRLIAGDNPDTVEKDRQQSRLSAIQGTLTQQAGSIAGGSLFGNVNATPESLISFLSERAAQAPAVAQFIAYANQLADYVSQGGTTKNPSAIFEIYDILKTYQGKVPSDLFNSVVNAGANDQVEFVRANTGEGKLFGPSGIYELRLGDNVNFDVFRSGRNTANALGSEISTDTGLAESLLSTIEQGNQAQIEIANNTKATAENTSKLTQLDDRRSGLLDLGNRRVISQGLAIDVDKLKIPDGAASVVLGSSLLPNSVNSETVNQLKNIVDLINESNEYLAIIAANTDGRANTNTTDFDNYLIGKLAQIRSRRIS